MSDGPSDSRRLLLIALGAVWVMAFVYAFVAYASTPNNPTGDQMSRPAVYLGWQGIAGMAAVALYGVGSAWEKGSAVRRLSRVPIALAFLQATAILAILVLAGAA